MTQKRYLIGTIVAILVMSLPYVLAQTSGMASAGLSLGFTAPLGYISHVLLVLALGVVAALLPREAVWLIPLSTISMIMASACVVLIGALMQPMFTWLLGSMLGFGVACGLSRHKSVLLAVLCAGSFGFHMGMHYAAGLPSIAAPLYYIGGMLGAIGMMFAIAISFGITLMGDHANLAEQITHYFESRSARKQAKR